MCGITGAWRLDLQGPALANLVEQMNTALKHRGPDGAAVWLAPTRELALGHRRLAIIDVTPTGLQPMISHSGRFAIVFNGEVYNFADIKRELETAGLAPKWSGTSDTEVMLAAIDAWGLEAAVPRCLGMFTFALYDLQARQLHLVRDRLGVKPLYFSATSQGVYFASELKALRNCPGVDTTIDRASLAAYLRVGCVPGSQSIYQGCQKVPPGTWLTFTADRFERPRLTTWWNALTVTQNALDTPFTGSAQAAADALEKLLLDCVRLRMVSDVPLGAFLSGGVDSSLVVSLMQAQSSRPVHTFSIDNEVAEFDESVASQEVARLLGTHHTSLRVSAADALDVIPQLPTMYDEPFADSSQIPTYLVSKLARQQVTVSLSGDGGDELFAGYLRHALAPQLQRSADRVPPRGRQLISKAIRALSVTQWNSVFSLGRGLLPGARIPGIRMHKLATALTADTPAGIYDALATHWSGDEHPLADPTPRRVSEYADLHTENLSEFIMFRDLVRYLPDDILTKVDRASMAVSLEAREPLLDHRLVEFAWRLPMSMKIRGTTGKWILRDVLRRYLPDSAIDRPKMGFSIPLGDWLRGPLRDWAETLLSENALRDEGFNVTFIRQCWAEHLSGNRPWETPLWDVLMYQAWRKS